jgi:ABC-type Fe3+-hydroxamate transport system substrate-binding protein
MSGPRVVSLVPSVTETLVAWGVVPVACTRFCEQPDLAHVGGTKNPDVAAIAALAPDLVVMDEEENRREDHQALMAAGVTVHVTAVRDLADVAPTLATLSERLGRPVEMAGPAPPAPRTWRAFVPIWRRPWMALATPTYGSSLLAALGVENVVTGPPAYPELTLDEVAARRPDVVLAPDEPYHFTERHTEELSVLGVPVLFIDGRDLFWWGWRTPGALERLGARLSDGRG